MRGGRNVALGLLGLFLAACPAKERPAAPDGASVADLAPRSLLFERFGPNPLLRPGPKGSWDEGEVVEPAVVQRGDQFLLWYEGDEVATGREAIGLATSSDGLSWQKHPQNPVLRPGPEGSWDEAGVGDPSVAFDGERYWLFYEGTNREGVSAIGLATSTDGLRFEKAPENPVLRPGEPGSWDERSLSWPAVRLEGGAVQLYYTGHDGNFLPRLGLATSSDGRRFQRRGLVLDLGPKGAWDEGGVSGCAVWREEDGYHLLYVGQGAAGQFIGEARSGDGMRFDRVGGGPVLRTGPAGSWDEVLLYSPFLLRAGDRDLLFYAGQDGQLGTRAIGAAQRRR